MIMATVVAMDTSQLPWVEKYRPNNLDDLISHQDIVSTIQRFLDQNRLPHLLLYGPAGTGKTTTALAITKRLYPSNQQGSMVLELNASDDRGIGIVRGPILNFASTKTMFSKGFKMVILDEADAMTNDAQNALRRVMEKYTENTRFCLICNYLSKVIPAIQSRCTRFRFGPIAVEQMRPRLERIANEEGVAFGAGGLSAVIGLSTGDMRRSINILQSTALAYSEVNENSVYACTGNPSKEDVKRIVEYLLNETVVEAFNKVNRLKTNRGYALQDLISEVHLYVQRIEFPTLVKVRLLIALADIEYRVAGGGSETIQLGSLVAAFHRAKVTVGEMVS